MKVAIIAEFGVMGGTRTYLLRLLRYFKERGDCVTVFAEENSVDKDILNVVANYGYSIEYIVIKDYRICKKIFDILPFIGDFPFLSKIRKYDIVFVSVGTPGKYLGGCLWNRKFVYIVHTYPFSPLMEEKFEIIGRQFFSWYFSTNRKIVTVSRYSRNQIAKYWTGSNLKKKITYIYHYTEGRKMSNINKSYITTLGHVTSYKNPGLWIKIARKVLDKIKNKKIRFIWIGEGDLLKNCQKETRFDKNIIFLGFKHNIYKWLKNTYVYLQLSDIESFGISVIEAMSCGIPCIVSNKGGLKEVVKDGVNGYVIGVKNIDGIVDKIVELLKDNKKRKIFSMNSQHIQAKLFSKKSWTNKMNTLINCIS